MQPVELGQQQRNIIDPFGLMVGGSVTYRELTSILNIRSKSERTMSYQSTTGG
jgi:hypothetical protein